MIEAVCVKSCYDSAMGMFYERNRPYKIDEKRFGSPKDGGNDLLKHFKTTAQLPTAVAEVVEAMANGDKPRSRARK